MNLLRYSDFLLESNLELILESKIGFSDKFILTLKQITNPLAQEILKLNNKDVDTTYNYIDITDENDSVTFIPDRKAQEILGPGDILYKVKSAGRNLTNSETNRPTYQRLGWDLPEEVHKPEVGTIGQILSETVGSNGRIYCLFQSTEGEHSGKKTVLNKLALEPFNPNFSQVWTSNRNKIKIGRLVRAIIRAAKISATDSEIEKFVNDYKSTIDILNDKFTKFDVVSGWDLINFYRIENYSRGGPDGTLGNSCMADVPEDWLYLYSKNPEVCQLVILYDDSGKITDGKYKSEYIIGRALLWKTRSGHQFMDRIYTKWDSDVELFKKFAEKNGWWCKKEQNSYSEFTAVLGQTIMHPVFVVDLKRFSFQSYPFLDTLSYLNGGTGELSNDHQEISAEYSLHSTSGDRDLIDD